MRTLVPIVLGLALLSHGCDDSEESPPHPRDALNFPLSVTADPSGDIVWVVSGNFDLGYRGGAVLALDILTNRFIPELAFEVGSFPGPFTILTDGDGRRVAGYVASRAEDALYHVKFDDTGEAPRLHCPEGAPAATGSGILQCPRRGAIVSARSAAAEPLSVGQDPFELAVLPSRAPATPDFLFSAGMRDGVLATYTLAADGTPSLVGNVTLTRGLFGLAADPIAGRVFATNKQANALNVFAVRDRNAGVAVDTLNPWLTPLQTLTITEFISRTARRDRARSAVLSADRSRLYMSFRGPDAVVVFDTRPSAPDTQLREIKKIPLSGDPGELLVLPPEGGRPELLLVSCFDTNRVEIVDPEAGAVVSSIRTGRGPSGLALIDRPDLGIRRLYVALFNVNAIAVIDLDPSSPSYLSTVAEIR